MKLKTLARFRTLKSELFLVFLLVFPVIFLCLLLVLFAVMTWLVVYPGPFICKLFKLYNFTDMDFKVLLVAVAALNLLICFVTEVSHEIKL